VHRPSAARVLSLASVAMLVGMSGGAVEESRPDAPRDTRSQPYAPPRTRGHVDNAPSPYPRRTGPKRRHNGSRCGQLAIAERAGRLLLADAMRADIASHDGSPA
jgi:hypothetical protein